MTITCYKNRADRRVVYKTSKMERVKEITGNPRDVINVTNPIIVIEQNGIIDFNYVYISELKRYYYVSDVTYISKNLIELVLDIDVLTTYALGISGLTAFVDRNQYIKDDMIEDDRRIVNNGYSNVYVDEIPNYILSTNGSYCISGYKLSVTDMVEV